MLALVAVLIWAIDLVLYWTRADVPRWLDFFSLLVVGLILLALHIAGVVGWRRSSA